jgi:hypothetical protein
MCFGGDPGDGQKKAAADLQAQQNANKVALLGYNARANPFFGLAQQRGEFGQSFQPDLAELIRNPTASPTFQLMAKEGLNALRSNRSVTGAPSSGPGQIQDARYVAGLAGHEIDSRNQLLFNTANQFQGQLPLTQEPQYLGQNTQLAQGIAQAHQADAQGGSGWSGLFGNLLGLGVSQLGSGGAFGKGGAFGSGGVWGPAPIPPIV